ncbi:MAG: DUF5680 domain-containing protein [Oscillospiraceae bacterium]|nr:DUF5680 domain-containing protein [Oscillospiraceae bacterium]
MNQDIIAFLLKAKKATYAGKGAEAEPSRPSSHDLQFTEGSLQYIDTYLGEAKFAGEEALWKDGVPFWAMNYAGRVIGEGFSGDFLKEAMSFVSEEHPFRGPPAYTNGDFTYRCSVSGDFHWFSGGEEIRLRDVKIYECVFHGGDVE